MANSRAMTATDIRRLERDRQAAVELADALRRKNERLQAEVERLRAALAKCRAQIELLVVNDQISERDVL